MNRSAVFYINVKALGSGKWINENLSEIENTERRDIKNRLAQMES